MNQGRISVDRDLLAKYAANATMLAFLVHILLNVGEDGTLDTSINRLAKELRISFQQVRTCLANLESNKVITKTATKIATKITLCEYDSYKGEQQSGNKAGNKEPTKLKKSPLSPPDSSPCTPSLSPLIFPPEFIKESSCTDVHEDEKLDGPVSPPSDFDFILRIWNESARRSVPKIRGLSPARKEKVRLRIREMGGWDEAKLILPSCFRKINESDFCNGSTGKWVATFDWFFENEKNWLKVLEGNYDNRKKKTDLERLNEELKKVDEYYGFGDNTVPAGGWEDTPDEQ